MEKELHIFHIYRRSLKNMNMIQSLSKTVYKYPLNNAGFYNAFSIQRDFRKQARLFVRLKGPKKSNQLVEKTYKEQ